MALFSLVITANAAVTFTTSVGNSNDPLTHQFDTNNNNISNSVVTGSINTGWSASGGENMYFGTSTSSPPNWNQINTDLYFPVSENGNSVTRTFSFSKDGTGFHLSFGGVSVGGSPNPIVSSEYGYGIVLWARGGTGAGTIGLSNLDIDGVSGPDMNISTIGGQPHDHNWGITWFQPDDPNNFTATGTTQWDYNGWNYGSLSGDRNSGGFMELGFSGKEFNSIPEPSSVVLLSLGGFMLIFRKRK